MLATLRASACKGPVALGANGVLGADELWQNAAVIAAALPPPQPGSMVAFAFGEDRAAFAAALLGTWIAGHGAALPENAGRECVVPVLERPQVVAFLQDTGVGRGIHVPTLLAESSEPAALPELSPESLPADPDRVVLEMHTAVDDGDTDIVAWSAEELLAVVDDVVAAMNLAPGAVVVHGYTPSFLPAVLAGLLAPLRLGGAFVLSAPRSVPRSAKELAELARTHEASVVLCSALQLRAFTALPSGALPLGLRLACPDTPAGEAVDALRVRHDVPVLSVLAGVYPSSEADEATERLLAVPGIEDATVAILGGGAAALVAIVGAEELLLSARAAAISVLAEDVELFVRTVPALARDGNGRISHGDLCAMFGRGRDGDTIVRDLEWGPPLAPDEDGTMRFRARVPERLAFFEGHFTTYPVLAGGVQLHELVLPRVREAMPHLGDLKRLEAIKFAGRIAPGDEIEVAIRSIGDGDRVQFEITCGDKRCTSGKLSFVVDNDTETAGE